MRRKSVAEREGKQPKKEKKKKSSWQEWKETAIFALIVVPLLNIFVLQSYAIPTSSMEGSMLVGDKLFVSKFHYGVKIPNTPLSLPFMHNTIWGTKMNSYTELLKLPDWRLPAVEEINSGDITVFNWPVGDTVTQEFQSTRSYYDLVRKEGRSTVQRKYNIITRPTDKKENYVKRCVAAAGDTLQLIDGLLFVNGQQFKDHEDVQHLYFVTTTGAPINRKIIDEHDIREVFKLQGAPNTWGMFLNKKNAEMIGNLSAVTNIKKRVSEAQSYDTNLFPYNPDLKWSIDNYGPIYMPKEGDEIELNETNYSIYERAIRVYEDNPSLTWNRGRAYIDGQAQDFYKFKMDYYYMIGDNRHNSQDSRAWGFVPKNHITGKPMFVWLSTKPNARGLFNKINWKKCFRRLR